MDFQVTPRLMLSLQTVVIASLVYLAYKYLPGIKLYSQLRKLPAFAAEGSEEQKQRYFQHGKEVYMEAYKKMKDKAFRMNTFDDTYQILVSPTFLPELRKLPDSVLNFPEATAQNLQTKYLKFDTDEPILTHSVKMDLTPALARINPVVFEEVQLAFEEEMPKCDDWTPVNIHSKLLTMVGRITGRIFLGPELCHDEEYLKIFLDFTTILIVAATDIKKIRPFLRPWLAPRLDSVRKKHQYTAKAKKFLEPIVEARREAKAKDPNYKAPDDMLSWMMARQEEVGDFSTERLSNMQLGLSFAAIHTTTMTATNILYTLAATPEYIEPLREEVRQVMAEHGGTITTRGLQQMLKMDSYMKEVSRFYPPSFTTFNRKVMRDFTLSNGQRIPAGTLIETMSHAVYQDSQIYSGPSPADVFDGFRAYKLRKAGGARENARNQFVTTNEENLMFGYGPHACPGRFFAAGEIKMLVARFLLDYDMKNEDGSTERYPQLDFGRMTGPDHSKNLLFKKVVAP